MVPKGLAFFVALVVLGADTTSAEVHDDFGQLRLSENRVREWLDGAGAPLLEAIEIEDAPKALSIAKELATSGDHFARVFWGILLLEKTNGESGWEKIEEAARAGNMLGRLFQALPGCSSVSPHGRSAASDSLKILAREGLAYAALTLSDCEYEYGDRPKEISDPSWATLSAALAGRSNPIFGDLFWEAFFKALELRETLEEQDRPAYEAAGKKAAREIDRLANRAYRGDPPEYELWAGAYVCGQGITGGILQVDGSLSSQMSQRNGILHIFAAPMNPGVPSGCVSGKVGRTVDPSGEIALRWSPKEWIIEVPGFTMTEGTIGNLEFGDTVARGEIDHPLCTEAVFQRVLLPPVDIPEACQLN